ncbi:MAG: pilus assembly protein PilM [Lentisphaeria bacterium]|jgi:Tfp pilus assembly PilM family ATPase
MKMPVKKIVGLDIGCASVKAVVFHCSGKKAQLERVEVFHARDEGILSDDELYSSIRDWLKSHGLDRSRITLGMPQYLSTTLVRDLPGVNRGALESLVRMEAKQLAGLSDEAFVLDFQPLPAGGGRNHPVLMALCRENAVRERLGHMQAVALRVDDLAMTGLAMVNAFAHLQPEAARAKTPILLLDLGHDNATAAVWYAGQALFMASLLFAGERFEQALNAKSRKGGTLAEVNLADEAPQSPFIAAARMLENEIHAAVEHWRNQEVPELADKPIEKVFLCGGASRLEGLAEWLQDRLECSVEQLGPTLDGRLRPELTVAYGLGLQGASRASIKLSLLPEEIRRQKKRLARAPFLAAGLLLFVLTGLGLELASWRRNADILAKLTSINSQLDQCGLLVSRLESTRAALQSQESKLIPLVAAGNQASRIAMAFAELGRTRGENDWLVYLGDELSFQATRAAAVAQRGQRKTSGGSAAPPPVIAPGGMFGAPAATGWGQAPEQSPGGEFPNRCLPAEVKYAEAFIAAGYTERQEQEQVYESVRGLVQTLNQSGRFDRVDILPEADCDGREDIFAPWLEYNKRLTAASGSKGYRNFTIRMPFAERHIRPPKAPPAPKKGGRRK